MKPRRFAEEFLALVRKYGLEQSCPEMRYAIRDAERDALSESRARYYFFRAEEFVAGLRHRPVHLFEAPEEQEDLYESGLPDVELGSLFNAPTLRFGINYFPIPRTTLIVGSAGTGKSTLVRGLLLQLKACSQRFNRLISAVVMSTNAGSLEDLATLCGDGWIVINVSGAACLSLMGPPSVPAATWITRVADLFASAYGLIAAKDVLAGLITYCVRYLNPTGAAPLLYPDFAMLIRVLRAIPHVFSEKQIYTQTLMQKLCEAERAAGNAFCTFRGLDINALIAEGKSVVMEVSSVESDALITFLTGLVTSAIVMERRETRHLVDGLEVLFVRDDADFDVSEKLSLCFGANGSPLEEYAQLGREMGLAAVISVHSLVGIAKGIAANCPNLIVFGLTDADSMGIGARWLLLNREQAQLVPALRTGECIVRQAQSLWPLPLIGCVDYVPPNRSTQPPVYTVPDCIPAKPLEEIPDLVKAIEAHRRPTKKPVPVPAMKRPKLGVRSRQLLDFATLHELAPLYFLLRQFQPELSASAQIQARHQLEHLELIECDELRIGRINVVLLRVTGGWAYLDKQPTATQGRGSLAHVCCQHWIAGVFRKRGHRAEIEGMVPGTSHPADVLVHFPEGLCDVEIIIGCDANLLLHLNNCLLVSKSIARVVVLATEKQELARLQEMVDAEPSLEPVRSRISLETIEPYMRELYG